LLLEHLGRVAPKKLPSKLLV